MASKKTKLVKKPKEQKNIITRANFAIGHPYGKSFETDPYYVGIANKIYKETLAKFNQSGGFPAEEIKRLSLMLTHYLEDLVSGSGVWPAFIALNERHYGRKLPFYQVGESDDISDVPTQEAIAFIIWYTLNDPCSGHFINPMNIGLNSMAPMILDILGEAYDKAPDTPYFSMESILTTDDEFSSFQFLRHMGRWLYESCYLTKMYPADIESCKDSIKQLVSSIAKLPTDSGLVSYSTDVFMSMNAQIGPSQFPVTEWLAEIAKTQLGDDEDSNLVGLLSQLKTRPYQPYAIKTVDETIAILEDIDGEIIELSSCFFNDMRFQSEFKPGAVFYGSFVYAFGSWQINGFNTISLDLQVFNSARKASKELAALAKSEFKENVERLGGKRIKIFSSFDEYQRFFGNPDSHYPDDVIDAQNITLFANENGTFTIVPNIGEFIKMRGNKLYSKEKCHDGGFELLFGTYAVPDEFARYLVDNKMMADTAFNVFIGLYDGRALFQDNIRFLYDYSKAAETLPFFSEDMRRYLIWMKKNRTGSNSGFHNKMS